jgi:Tfp pilus assembly protein PilF
MRRYLNALIAIAVILPACDQFVCSQSRIKAIEIANKGVEHFTNRAYESAERELRLAIQTDPTYETAYYNVRVGGAAQPRQRQLPLRPG